MTSEAQDGVSGIPEGEEVEGSAVSSQPPVGGALSDAPPPSEPSVVGGATTGDPSSPTKHLSGDVSVTGQEQSVKDSDVKASLDSLRKAGGLKGRNTVGLATFSLRCKKVHRCSFRTLLST